MYRFHVSLCAANSRALAVRDADGHGVYEGRTIFTGDLNAPYALVLVGDRLYAANQDALVFVPFRDGRPAGQPIDGVTGFRAGHGQCRRVSSRKIRRLLERSVAITTLLQAIAHRDHARLGASAQALWTPLTILRVAPLPIDSREDIERQGSDGLSGRQGACVTRALGYHPLTAMNIYVSPHHDDVCFSIGHLAARQGGALVNVFTRSNYTAIPVWTGDQDRISCITGLRRDEDRLFAEQAGLTRHEIGLDETSVIGRDSFDLSNLDDEVAMLRGSLIAYLEDLLPEDAGPQTSTLFCPMGIGGHRNHKSILLAVRAAFGALSRRCAIWLYEDLHYASNAEARRRGIAHARQAFAGIDLKAAIVRLDAAAAQRKLDWIRLYKTQHRRPVEAGRYTPATGVETTMHEMVYRCQTAMAGSLT